MRANRCVYGWHFLPADCRLAHGDGRLVRVGRTLSVRGKLELCERGLHASPKLIDALFYATEVSPNGEGRRLCRVVVSGDVIVDPFGEKVCGRRRRVLWMLSPERTERIILDLCFAVVHEARNEVARFAGATTADEVLEWLEELVWQYGSVHALSRACMNEHSEMVERVELALDAAGRQERRVLAALKALMVGDVWSCVCEAVVAVAAAHVALEPAFVGLAEMEYKAQLEGREPTPLWRLVSCERTFGLFKI